ncbi:MAG: RnfABCDGE type electron transport complex subunit D, partial [Clostridiales bacterium]|nr:RnfABCDGE type electron transport complex subunit D [Clostridiales bacterium]
MESPKTVVTSTPHIRSASTVPNTMKAVLLALAPAAVTGVFFFGVRALLVMALSVASCVAFEALYQKLTGQEITVSDFSAAVTGLLLAFNLPVSSPFWMPIVGAFVAIVITKQLFGGLGQNFLNPALAGRAFLVAAYTPQMTSSFTEPVRNFIGVDAVASATPLQLLKSGDFIPAAPDHINALLGNMSGTIGETCAVALILGGLFLIFIKVITWHVPVTFIATVFLFTAVFQPNGFFGGYPLYHILAGGLMLGAFFMATDYSSSPVTPLGKIIMGV